MTRYFFTRVKGRLSRLREKIRETSAPYRAVAECHRRFWFAPQQKSHGLQNELIVSLTSYRPRFATLALSLRCLLSQTVAPDRVLLWLAEEDARVVPSNVKRLQGRGLDIRLTEDIGSYKKIIPTLVAFPEAIIVTADDDIFYEADWLEALVGAWDGYPNQVVCHRAHCMLLGEDGLPRPYAEWMSNAATSQQAGQLFPTAGRGALFPPGALSPAVTDKRTFLELCPNADDLWLYWMSRKAGARYKLVKKQRPIIMWPGSQHVALYDNNRLPTGNDQKIANLIAEFGFPGFYEDDSLQKGRPDSLGTAGIAG